MLGSLANLGSLVRMSVILHERGKSIPAAAVAVRACINVAVAKVSFLAHVPNLSF